MEKEADFEEGSGYVYIISDGSSFKIGVSKDPLSRMKQLQTGNKNVLTLEHCELKNEPYKVEKFAHRHLQSKKGEGEWFECTYQEARIAILLCTEYD